MWYKIILLDFYYDIDYIRLYQLKSPMIIQNIIYFESDPGLNYDKFKKDITYEYIPMYIMPAYIHDIILANDNYLRYYNNDDFSDINIYLANRILKLNKIILSLYSEYFYKIIKENPNNDIHFEDVNIIIAEQLFKLMYGYKNELNSIQTLELINLAEFFNINIDNKEVIIALQLNDIRYNKKEKYEKAISIINKIYPYGMPEELIKVINNKDLDIL